ncbi:MAG: acyl-CoA dehydrogenase, partial [Citricoccus sp.]|nr:acyl-CoA dehydrogenase [Citricoccus sp. WCRC_4]
MNTATRTATNTATTGQSPSGDVSASFLGPVDLTGMDGLFSAQEKALALQVRGLVDEVIRPNIADWYEQAVFPREIVPELGRLGVLGMHL